jgi:S-adenosylmethionine:tRNA ribosyltransferase-isomerase
VTVGEVSYSIEDYDYELPRELIAQAPLADRAASRLLVLERRTRRIEHRRFRDLPDLLTPGDLLVVNRSRVLPARLLARRPGGGAAEVLLVRRRGRDSWTAMVRPGRRLRPGTVLAVAPGFQVRIEPADAPDAADAPTSSLGPTRLVRLLVADGNAEAAIHRHGHVPLPPYIRRPDTPADRERYQTVYASNPGSVAAPTAGLHFTEELLERVAARGIHRAELVLHVGPGTFRPVEAADVRRHRVDAEAYELPDEAAAAVTRATSEGRRVIAVGTTTTRALEAAAARGPLRAHRGETDLVLYPGCPFRVVDALLTNFHLPRSSLLLLVSAFAGREAVLAAYAEAVRERYRFYSYGDAMLIL